MDPGRVPGSHLLGQSVGEREDHVVDDPLRLAEAREAGAREARVVDRPFRSDHPHRPEDAVVLRDVLGERRLVEQDRANGVVGAHEQRPLVGDVVGGWHLRMRAGQIDRDLVALDPDRRLDPQADAAVAGIVVEPACRSAVLAVRDLGNLGPEHPLRVVHPVVGGTHHHIGAVTLHEPQEAVAPELAGGEHRVHVAAVHRLGPDVVEDHPVEVLVQLAAPVPAEAVVELRLGVHVERVRVDPRERAADVEHMGGDCGEAQVLALVEDRHGHCDVRRVRGAEVGMVVHDHIPFVDLPAEGVHEAADVPGQRADVHRGRVRLAELASVGVEDPRAEVLRLADDRGVAHPEEHPRHLLRDGVESTAEDAQCDRVDLDPAPRRRAGLPADFVVDDAHAFTSIAAARAVASADAPVSMTMLPRRSTWAAIPGGIAVVESYWFTIAGPSSRLPAFSAARS